MCWYETSDTRGQSISFSIYGPGVDLECRHFVSHSFCVIEVKNNCDMFTTVQNLENGYFMEE